MFKKDCVLYISEGERYRMCVREVSEFMSRQDSNQLKTKAIHKNTLTLAVSAIMVRIFCPAHPPL